MVLGFVGAFKLFWVFSCVRVRVCVCVCACSSLLYVLCDQAAISTLMSTVLSDIATSATSCGTPASLHR